MISDVINIPAHDFLAFIGYRCVIIMIDGSLELAKKRRRKSAAEWPWKRERRNVLNAFVFD